MFIEALFTMAEIQKQLKYLSIDEWERLKVEEKGMTEDEMVGWRCQLDGHEFEYAPNIGDGQGSLVCCSPCGCKELDTNERLN